MRPITSDLSREDERPYFLWDEDLSVRELREALLEGPDDTRRRLLAKVMREARDDEVWHFTKPDVVARELPELAPWLGKRRAFWDFLITAWRQHGLVP